MCGRFQLIHSQQELAAHFATPHIPPVVARYNITPTQPVICIGQNGRDPLLQGFFASWGLIPAWLRSGKTDQPLFNARGETIAEKPSFRGAFRYRRCLIPASGFYEWQRGEGQPQPYHLTLPNQAIVAFAALWEAWQGAEGEELITCAIVTTAAKGPVSAIHHRMPAALSAAEWPTWLAGQPKAAQALIDDFGDKAAWQFRPIGTAINKAFADGPEVVAPFDPETAPIAAPAAPKTAKSKKKHDGQIELF